MDAKQIYWALLRASVTKQAQAQMQQVTRADYALCRWHALAITGLVDHLVSASAWLDDESVVYRESNARVRRCGLILPLASWCRRSRRRPWPMP